MVVRAAVCKRGDCSGVSVGNRSGITAGRGDYHHLPVYPFSPSLARAGWIRLCQEGNRRGSPLCSCRWNEQNIDEVK
jgi:hypothetical protein